MTRTLRKPSVPLPASNHLRFSGLSRIYDRSRPAYAAQALDHLKRLVVTRSSSLVADVGSGTGISSRWLALLGARVRGIEPNADMRHFAMSTGGGFFPDQLVYLDGSAENTGLASASIDLAVAASAFHWFEPMSALEEIKRLLRPAGYVALIWNSPDTRHALTRAFVKSVTIASGKNPYASGRRCQRSALSLLRRSGYEDGYKLRLAHEQVLSFDLLLDRALSTSSVPRTTEARRRIEEILRPAFQAAQSAHAATLHYTTVLVVGRKPNA